jgi:hypothetical protein
MKNHSLALAAIALGAIGATQTARASEPDFAAEIPFHDCLKMICMDVALGGSKPLTMLLDTGNVNSHLMTDAATKLGWKLEPIVQDDKPLDGIFRGGEHEVGLGQSKSSAKFIVIDRSKWGENPPPVDGSLAYTFFKDRVLQIDYPHHVLRMSAVLTAPTAQTQAPGTLQLITFGKSGPPILVGGPFMVNGKALNAQIDTCYTGTLVAYDAALEKLGLHKSGKPELFPFTDGGVNMLSAPVQSLGFATTDLLKGSAHMYFVGEGKNAVHQPDNLFEATVGNALFAHSVVTMDFHAMTLDVAPAT